MDARLVDTNVVSYLLKGDSRGDLYATHLDGKQLYVSFVTVAELYRWAVRYNWGGARLNALREKLANYGVLQSDDQTCWEWARVMTIKGQPVAPGDGWIAATALRHGLPLVTHNRRHFEAIPGLQVISEA